MESVTCTVSMEQLNQHVYWRYAIEFSSVTSLEAEWVFTHCLGMA